MIGSVEDHGSIQEQGRRVLTALHGALRALKLYPLENEAVQHALDDVHRLVVEVMRPDEEFELQIVGEFFFLNETRLRLDLSNFATFGNIAQTLQNHGVGTLGVLPGVERSEWAPFLSLLIREPAEENPLEAFLDRLSTTPARHFEVEPEKDPPDHGEVEEETLERAKRTYAQSVRVARDVMTDVRLGKAVNARKVKRAVQGIVDQVLSNEPSIVTMTTLRDFDEYTFTHSVNVSIFSVVIGQRLGLDRMQLFELGLGALLHDVGKMRIDRDIITKPSGLDEDEWEQVREHPTEGLLHLFQTGGYVNVPYRQMLIAYEHHMKIDASGYPVNRRPRVPSLFSRIVAVADGFDAATTVRSYQHRPWGADKVLREMRENPDRGYDPLLVKVLITATGVFPVGTLVILDTLELAVVYEANPDPTELHLPRVRIISDPMGVPLSEPLDWDLSKIDPETGSLARSILKTTDPQKYGIRVADYLI